MNLNKKGILLYVLSLIIGIFNDWISRFLSSNISFWEITFFRLFFSTLFILPIILYKKKINTKRFGLHTLRGFLLFISLSLWNYGLTKTHFTIPTLIGFSSPIFIVLLAAIFLKERISWKTWIATTLGFLGILISINISNLKFNYFSLSFVLSISIFSFLDILNKKYVVEESTLSMLFYSTLVSSIIIAPFCFYNWTYPSLSDLLLLVCLGFGGIFSFYLLLKAFIISKASTLAPFKYIELPLSVLISYFSFGEIPSINTFLGALFLIPCTLYILYSEYNRK